MADPTPRVGEPSARAEGADTGPPPLRLALLLTLILIAGAGMRLWGIRHGLPYLYSIDERLHFVAPAVGFFSGDFNPHYFLNPPGLSYLIYAVLRVWYSPDTIAAVFATSPEHVFLIGRLVTVATGTATSFATYLVGARIGGRRVGIVSALLMAIGFLPVSQARWAVNDVPAVLPLTIAILMSVRILQEGRLRDFVLAGAFSGLAAGTKYTAAIAFLPFVLAALYRLRSEPSVAARRLVIGVCVSVLAFAAVNPYAVLDAATFSRDVVEQTTGTEPKIGQGSSSGIAYYVWVLTWGVGWLPALVATIGAALLAKRDARATVVLLVPAAAFLFFMGTRARFFSRWALPLFPIVCVLAAFAAIALVRFARRWGPRRHAAVIVVMSAALVAQSLVHVVNAGDAHAREDTRSILRRWMVDHVVTGTRVVIEPVVPPNWFDERRTDPAAGNRWRRVSVGGPLEEYVAGLSPQLIDQAYREAGVCLVIVASTQMGRAERQSHLVPGAVAYYRRLARRSEVVFRTTPWARGAAQPFDFDFSANLYPFAYDRPGPALTAYRLDHPGCRGTVLRRRRASSAG